MSRKPVITRAEFIRRYMADCNVSYIQACQIYDTTVAVIEDAIVSGTKIGFGRVGSIVPVRMPPRVIHMGFKSKKGRSIEKVRREYNIGSRIKWRFQVYRKFLATHRLNWFA